MSDIEEGCGCIWGAISGIMVIGGLIFALTNGSSSKSSSVYDYEAPPTHYSPPTPPRPNYQSLPIQSLQTVPTYHSVTPDDAYDEGYNDGYEQGRDDGRKGRRHGYGYDDSNDYYDHYETMYCDGYESGYNDGYSSGHSYYEANTDEDDY